MALRELWPEKHILSFRDENAVSTFTGLDDTSLASMKQSVTTVKVFETTWKILAHLKDFRIEYLWLTSLEIPYRMMSSFCVGLRDALVFAGRITVKTIESFDLTITWDQDVRLSKDYTIVYSALAQVDLLGHLPCDIEELKIYVTVDAGELQMLFWDRVFALPALCTSVSRVVLLTNSRSIFATASAPTLGIYLSKYIGRWKNLRSLSLHGLWTQVQTLIIKQVPFCQLTRLSISLLPADGSFPLDDSCHHGHVLQHLHRHGVDQRLGFYGVNGVAEAVKPFAAVAAHELMIDLTTVRKQNGVQIVERLAEVKKFNCHCIKFRRKGSKEPLETSDQLNLKDAWSSILDKIEGLVFECKFDFETTSSQVWDPTFASIMHAIAEKDKPLPLKRLRFEDCELDVGNSTRYMELADVCQRALRNLPQLVDVEILLKLVKQRENVYGYFGKFEALRHPRWSFNSHKYTEEAVRRHIFILCICLKKFCISKDIMSSICSASFQVTAIQEAAKTSQGQLELYSEAKLRKTFQEMLPTV